ncbi:MAG: hypothetical protein U0P30_01470 [Vicinamibacterales bacterium]
MPIRRRTVRIALAALLLSAGPLLAQDDTVTIGLRPTPGQSQRLRTTQTLVMTMTPEGAPPPGFPAEGINLEQESITVMRQDVGLADDKGRVRHDMTYESMTQTSRINGKELPLPGGRADVFNGKTITLWVDAAGEIADVGLPEGFPLAADQMRAMLAPMVSAVPRQPLKIGQSITKPFSMNIPVPAGGAAPTITATTKTTLRAIEGIGTDRVAAFDMAVSGTLDGQPAGNAPRMTMTIEGTGTMRQHIASGLILDQASDQTIDGYFTLPAPGAPRMTMKGRVRVVSTKVE